MRAAISARHPKADDSALDLKERELAATCVGLTKLPLLYSRASGRRTGGSGGAAGVVTGGGKHGTVTAISVPLGALDPTFVAELLRHGTARDCKEAETRAATLLGFNSTKEYFLCFSACRESA